MVCCAIAVFILSQIYVALATVREFLFGPPDEGGTPASGAAAWRLGAPATRRAYPLPRLTPRRLAGAVVLGATSLVVAVSLLHGEALAGMDGFLISPEGICGWLPTPPF